MVNLIVVTHGEFGAYLVEAAEEIVGVQESGVRCVSISSRLSVAEVREHLARAMEELRTEEGLIIAVDMPGGTPCNIAMSLAKDDPMTRVVCGVNLYMIVTAFSRRRRAGLDELCEAVIAAGKKAILEMKSLLLARA
ncbi:MAG: PTS fructose transporter subunit IIA [Elusimicrobiota bacterium]